MSTKRIVLLDLARGLAIFFMIMQHAMLIYGVHEGEGSVLGELIILSGTAPAAPVFMLIMGIFFLRAKDTKTIVIRGLKLIGLGYLLNLFRFVLPTIIAGEYAADGPDSLLGRLMAVDILQMAGLSLICMSLVRRMRPPVWLSLAFLVALISPLLWRFAPRNLLLDLLWGTNQNVAFPLFPWLIYPLLGMYWGTLFTAAEDVPRFMKKTAVTGTGLILAGGTLMCLINNTWLPVGEYSRGGIGVHLLIIGFVFIWLWLLRLIEDKTADSRLTNLLIFWSKNVTAIYIIQWVLIGWGMLVLGYQQLAPVSAAFAGLIVTILTHGIGVLYLRVFKRHDVS